MLKDWWSNPCHSDLFLYHVCSNIVINVHFLRLQMREAFEEFLYKCEPKGMHYESSLFSVRTIWE